MERSSTQVCTDGFGIDKYAWNKCVLHTRTLVVYTKTRIVHRFAFMVLACAC